MDFSENFLKRLITAAILTLVFLTANILYFETFLVLLVVSLIALLKEWWELSANLNGYLRRSVIGFFWFAPALFALGWLRYFYGASPVFWAVSIVVASDVAAYFCGRTFGKRKIFPLISPGKTWEGFLGGLTAAGVVGAVLGIILGGDWAAGGVLVALLASIAGVIGDFTESYVKRCAGVKDSGQILPGHGGVLDRLDSHLFGLPIFVVGVMMIGWPT
ncbi:MAG: phosphatidate cytidylyltransferase [Alphaproteobacteria bacterium]